MVAALYALAMVVLLVYGVNLLWLSVAYAWHDRAEPGPVPEPGYVPVPDETWPSVTVQLPLYNEAYVAERLIDACAALSYPRALLEIQVLDDSTDDTASLARRRVAYWQARGVDIVHLQRAGREGYKAGALQNGLTLARGAYLAIFDADFMPPADFLRRIMPHFHDPAVGMVQARWEHFNATYSLLTRIQALGLDAHFAVEQQVRARTGCFINFNGTAGVWRRACVEDAGGWQSDTLTEDLDLSYRAQLRGWRFHYAADVAVPAELPVDLAAFRAQQFRWTKGAAETARKMLGRLWRSDQPLGVKLEGTLHLTAHVVFLFIFLAVLLHAPLLWLEGSGRGPGAVYFALMGFGLIGFLGFFLAQLFAQRALYPDWLRRLWVFPVFMAGSMGLSLSNTRAILEALLRRRSAFVRTPKYSVPEATARMAPRGQGRYADRRLPRVAWLEALVGLYCLAGLGVTVAYGQWAAVPFQALFVLGFGLITTYNLQQYRRRRHA